MKKIFMLPLCVSLLGCVSATITRYDDVQKNRKISVADDYFLSRDLINILHANNYDVFIKNKKTDIGYMTIKSNYELLVEAYGFDMCIVGGRAYNFSLSVVDLSTSKELFNYSGQGCHDTILDNFTKLINNESIQKSNTTKILDLRQQ